VIWNREKTLEILQMALNASAADETEAVFQAHSYGLTRFAGSAIHQNMSEEDAILAVRVALGKKLGTYATNQLDEVGIRNAVKRAVQMAGLNEANPDFAGFAPPAPVGSVTQPVYVGNTAKAGPDDRAEIAGILIDTVDRAGFEAAGAVSNGAYVSAVSTNHGQSVYQMETRSHGLTVVNRPGQAGFGTGYAEWYGRDFSQFDPASIGQQAAAISAMNYNAESIEPGEYTVVLSPSCVGLLLYYLSWMGFHARAVQSKQSFLTGRWGEPILSDKLSIWDDALDGRGYGIPFDWEGRPKRRVDFVDRGKAHGVVYDSFTAARDSGPSTGHALSPLRDRYYSSPMAEHLFMAPGDTAVEEMIASTQRGILINHLWYVREVHYGKTIVTGMTRDGTFLIENGKVTKALRNLRFTQNIAEAFRHVDFVGKDLHFSEQFIGSSLTPALKLSKFYVAGASSF
jgi:PmbA protein